MRSRVDDFLDWMPVVLLFAIWQQFLACHLMPSPLNELVGNAALFVALAVYWGRRDRLRSGWGWIVVIAFTLIWDQFRAWV